MSDMRSAEVTRQRHERGLCFMMGGRSVCFVFLPNKEGQVGQPSFCSTSVFYRGRKCQRTKRRFCGVERLISVAYSTAGLWPTWLLQCSLISDLPQTPHDCVSPVEKCFHLVHFKMCFHTEARGYQSRWPAASSFRIFLREEA